MVLIQEQHLAAFVHRLGADEKLRRCVNGVFVQPSSRLRALSHAEAFPLSEFAPYEQRGHVWNPAGTGIATLDIGVPIFLLEGNAVGQAEARAADNRNKVGGE